MHIAPWIAAVAGLAFVVLVAYPIAFTKGYQASRVDWIESQSEMGKRSAASICADQVSAALALECYRRAEQELDLNLLEAQDLNAQREMANWAEALFWATTLLGVFSLITTVVGLLYVRRTLVETRSATEVATSAAEAAIFGNSIADEAYRIDRRPWVEIFGDPQIHVEALGNKIHVDAEIIVKNIGKTPAMDVWLASHLIDYYRDRRFREAFVEFFDAQLTGHRVGRDLGLNMLPAAERRLNCRVTAEVDLLSRLQSAEPVCLALALCLNYSTSPDAPPAQTCLILDIRTSNRPAFPIGDNALNRRILANYTEIPGTGRLS